MTTLGNADPLLTEEIGEIFHSEDLLNPLCGLTTGYMQKKCSRRTFILW